MRFNKANLRRNAHLELEEDIVFTPEQIAGHVSLLDIKDIHAIAKLTSFGEIIKADIEVKGTLVLECAYSLKPLKRKLHIKDTLQFSNLPQEEDDILYVPTPDIDLNAYIFGLILLEVPPKVVKRGAKLPKEGKGYRVLTEEEFIKEKEAAGDPRFVALDKFEE